jgi:hypothetical protein
MATPMAPTLAIKTVTVGISIGTHRMSYKSANSRYLPGRQNPEWTVADVPAR